MSSSVRTLPPASSSAVASASGPLAQLSTTRTAGAGTGTLAPLGNDIGLSLMVDYLSFNVDQLCDVPASDQEMGHEKGGVDTHAPFKTRDRSAPCTIPRHHRNRTGEST